MKTNNLTYFSKFYVKMAELGHTSFSSDFSFREPAPLMQLKSNILHLNTFLHLPVFQYTVKIYIGYI